MKLFNLKSAYGLANDLYGITISESAFENLALNAWELIGNKHTRLYRYIGSTDNKALELPCNVDVVESVHLPINDAQVTNSASSTLDTANISTERYIDAYRGFDDIYYQKGKFAKYKEVDGTLYFSRDYPKVMVVYHGVEVDDEGLPKINDKEMRAIAAYVAYATLYKEGLTKRDGGIIQLASTIQSDWLKFCNSARVPSYINQNDMDSILDVKYRWPQKNYGKSFKPII